MKVFEGSTFSRIFERLILGRNIYIAASAAMISALILIFLQKTMLTDTEFVIVSITFAAASVISVVAQMGDDSDILESQGAPLWKGPLAFVILRITCISIILSIIFVIFNSQVNEFGFIKFIIFSAGFSMANWAYNLRRNQALMRHDDVDFRNASLLCAVVRLGGFASLAPLLGQYALVSEVIARALLVPAMSSSKSGSLNIAPFSVRKLVRSFSYSTDALVQSQTLTAISLVSTVGPAATIILVVRIIFYGTGGLSQVVGTLFNRKIFQQHDVSFFLYTAPGIAFSLVLAAGLWLCYLFGAIAPADARSALGITLALLAFPALHPLSRIFTATNRESAKLILQLLYCGSLVLASTHYGTLWSTISVAGIFSVLYGGVFVYQTRIYRSAVQLER